jgi:hypothetical protein
MGVKFARGQLELVLNLPVIREWHGLDRIIDRRRGHTEHTGIVVG